jgi:predicted house-cleaning noncanonical NTP pyrophosphatase (MazG superfamily)
MKKIIYNKLVRDKIPEIIKESGSISKIHKLNQAEFKKELAKKILEEGKELCEAKSNKDISNELSDLLELIQTIARQYKISPEKLEEGRIDKYRNRGGFEKQLFLEYVEEK